MLPTGEVSPKDWGASEEMLVLTRRVNESIVIGENITITVVAVQGHGAHAQVRLGIAAPRETAVLRQEVYEAVRSENQRALRPAESKEPAGTMDSSE